MAHELTIRADGYTEMAFVGETPWHGLGQVSTPDSPMEQETGQAGQGYTVLESLVEYKTPAVTGHQVWPDRKVLHRSDTGAALAVVSKDYKTVQPAEVMGFFQKLLDLGGFQMETAGALSQGRRVWALARVGDGAEVVDGDVI